MMGFRENPAESGGRVVARQVYTMPIPGGLFEGWAVIYTLVHYTAEQGHHHQAAVLTLTST